MEKIFNHAADVIRNSEVLIITSGAGMSVDSGLPDYRGINGFWNKYPFYKDLEMDYMDLGNPLNFIKDPEFAWGFYWHRLKLYRNTQPHQGYFILQKWVENLNLDYFVITSNIDGLFYKTGFPDERVLEIHGSLHFNQCTKECKGIWENEEQAEVDLKTMRTNHVPKCPYCGATARPNILMFGDPSWIDDRSIPKDDYFEDLLQQWRKDNKKITVIEMGAGETIPSIRLQSETIAYQTNGKVIRINPRDYHVDEPFISLPFGALEALSAIDKILS